MQQFDVQYEELAPKDLEVVGHFPAYTAGVLFRNGLGPRELATDKRNIFRVNHWFDALAQVHRFQIYPQDANGRTRITHNSRRTCDTVIERIIRTGDRSGYTFAAKYDPCLTFFQKLQSFFKPAPRASPSDVSISVTLSANFPGLSKTGKERYGPFMDDVETLCNKTDASQIQMLDPQTLEPLGIARQETLHPLLKGPTSGAHAKVCPFTGDVYNYNLEFGGRLGAYRVFHVSASTGQTSILATIKAPPAYLHSMFMSENFLILCVWNSFFSAAGAPILWMRNYLEALAKFDSSKPATWYVIDRIPLKEGGRGLVATYTSDAFFCFHTINAYEEPSMTSPGQTDIVADFCSYESTEVITRFYIENMISDSPKAKAYSDPANKSCRAAFTRVKLESVSSAGPVGLNKVQPVFKLPAGSAPELPSLAGQVRTKKHRYVYGVTDTGAATFFDGLIKYDVSDPTNITSKTWSRHGQSAGEPIFIADPARLHEEDGGVLLTVVLDGVAGKSYLLVLDAQNMTEVARANVDGVVGFGFHGTHVKSSDGEQSQL